MSYTKLERVTEVRRVITKLTSLHVSASAYSAIKELMKLMQTYIETGEDTNVLIPFPEYNCTIEGNFPKLKRKGFWVKLAANKEQEDATQLVDT